MEVIFAPAAAADPLHIRTYIGRFNPAAARRMAERIKAAALSLAEHPERGAQREDGSRRLLIVPPYEIVYDVRPGRVTVLRIWHGAQDR